MSQTSTAAAGRARAVWWTGLGEALTLAVLLANVATVHAGALSSLVGPLHGLLYVVGIALVWSSTATPRARVLSLVPGIGTLLAVRAGAGREVTS